MQVGRHRTVAVVVYERLAAFEMSVPCEVFSVDRSAMGATYGLLVCAAEPPPLRITEGSFTIDTPTTSATSVRQMPAWRDVHETPPDSMLDALRAGYDRGSRIASLCSRAFVPDSR